RGVFYAASRDFGSAQIAFDVERQSHYSAFGLDRLDDARNHSTFVVGGNEVVEGVAFQLLDAQRDALFVGIDTKNHGVDLVALLEVANCFFTGVGPGQVGQVHQAVDAARQTDEHAKVSDGLDSAVDFVATFEVDSELFPRIG